MDNDDDFTFCQVASPVDQDSIEANVVIPGVNNISIKDDCADSTSNHRSSGILWSDKLPNDPALTKHATAGSLTFKVIDASSQSSEPPKKAPVNVVRGSVKTSEPKNAVRKPASRAKVPFQIGYSPMDWQKLARKHPDLAGLKGQSNKRLIPLSEVKQHQTEDAMWTVLKGRVYNIAPYMKFHPGGVDMLMKAVGKDCTSLFNKYHAWVNAEFLLEKCLVGTLDDTK